MKENSLMESFNAMISPYDASYPIMLLSQGIKKQLKLANQAVDVIYKVALKEAPLAFQLNKERDDTAFYIRYRYCTNRATMCI